METLESLKTQNSILKDLLIDTENELENVRKLSKAELMKSQNLIKSVAPCLLGMFSETSHEKFTQFSTGLDFNSSILVADQLEKLLQRVSRDGALIQKGNEEIQMDIQRAVKRSEELTCEVKKQREVIKELKNKKDCIFRRLERIRYKSLIFEASLGNDPEPSVLKILRLD
jgi:hypothetical protein